VVSSGSVPVPSAENFRQLIWELFGKKLYTRGHCCILWLGGLAVLVKETRLKRDNSGLKTNEYANLPSDTFHK